MKQAIEIADHDIEEIVGFLNMLLKDEYALYTKTRNVHWNANELNFHKLYNLFEIQYKTLDIIIDDIAERVRSLGHFALGSLKEFLSLTDIHKETHDFSSNNQMIQILINNHETIIYIIRNNISPVFDKYGDLDTYNFVMELVEKHKKMSAMLKSNIS